MRRRKKPRKIVPPPRTRAELEREFGKVWDTHELAREFVITSIIGSTVVVRRKTDDVVGTMKYQSNPPLYFGFVEAPKTD
ncbi:MAG: hypothetical protein HYX68_14150 [Planctomycetes bacterium]|nr:hypothetical protein [Planctomycetota bacterium]